MPNSSCDWCFPAIGKQQAGACTCNTIHQRSHQQISNVPVTHEEGMNNLEIPDDFFQNLCNDYDKENSDLSEDNEFKKECGKHCQNRYLPEEYSSDDEYYYSNHGWDVYRERFGSSNNFISEQQYRHEIIFTLCCGLKNTMKVYHGLKCTGGDDIQHCEPVYGKILKNNCLSSDEDVIIHYIHTYPPSALGKFWSSSLCERNLIKEIMKFM